ncbi:Eco47II family restriction endonuclease [Anaerorhabdus furcosa]|uniref:Eco47II restriction endonuclease n=1 Tax=Anaerorhabdus furcosa TaxID=118967 RepID=A0A1T4MJC0_9FIRM|nr:Eco47II family restriction endonuclease [Anaerorhabdus furcosa]SJZ66848.1 Eco47II restriction endonuclease [Anaerorhabdus furcosa]
MYNLNFISEENFKIHVKNTIEKYGEKLNSYDLDKFNKNIIDPIKLIFDKTVYGLSWDEIIASEVSRQRDKSNNNDIGYFHQRIFQYFDNCEVPANGTNGGWDVIYKNANGINLPEDIVVDKIFVEMKNKHNTMNSASQAKTFIKMQSQLLRDDNCACFLVEAIAQKSQNIKWNTTVDGDKVGHKLIRRVSIDQFYSLVTGEENAFYDMCLVLPEIIEEVVFEMNENRKPNDKVLDDLIRIAGNEGKNEVTNDMLVKTVYLLAFSSYLGFSKDGD